eukprot:403344354
MMNNVHFLAQQNMNSLIYQQVFGFSKFRKRLGLYSYKLTKNNKFRDPHAMPLYQKQQYKKQGYKGEIKIREVTRNSERPFGKISRKGNFSFEIQKVPFYNVPDLTNFKLKPYVSYTTPKVGDQDKVQKQIAMTPDLLEDINQQILNAPKGSLIPRNQLDPVSALSRKTR